MANVNLKEKYFKFPNEVADAVARVTLNASQHSILWVIWRETYGWSRSDAYISLSEFIERTGMEKSQIIRTIRSLEQINMITVTRRGTRKSIYSFQDDYGTWGIEPREDRGCMKQLVAHEDNAGGQTSTTTGDSRGPTISIKEQKKISARNTVNLSGKSRRINLDSGKLLAASLREKFPSLSHESLKFIDSVRKANKLGCLVKSRAVRIAASLMKISEDYNADILGKAFWVTFKKVKDRGFNFTTYDPTAYVRTVAEGLWYREQQEEEKGLIRYPDREDRFFR